MTNGTIFEYDTTAGFSWTDRDLVALERLRRAVGAEVLRAVVRNGQHELQAAQHVGVVRLGNRAVQVLPKIYRTPLREGEAPAEPQIREATSNLLHLLEEVVGYSVSMGERGADDSGLLMGVSCCGASVPDRRTFRMKGVSS